MYALFDHEGSMQYVGITTGDRAGFRDRIYSRHVTGSEDRSHKFSRAYNTGRMWRDHRDDSPDARVAKRLRTEFIRRYCRAACLSVPADAHAALPELEASVQSLASEMNLGWGDKRGFQPLAEPSALVDALIDELGLTEDERAAVERQRERCNTSGGSGNP